MALNKREVHRRQRAKSGILKPEEVARIKWLLASETLSARQIAEAYSMSLWAIKAIARGDTWAWVEPDGGPVEQGAVGLGEPPIGEAAEAIMEKMRERLRQAPSLYESEPSEERFVRPDLMDKMLGQVSKEIAQEAKVESELEQLEHKGDSK
jgi:hypothetical protein